MLFKILLASMLIGTYSFADDCSKVLSSPSTLCGVEVNELSNVNLACITRKSGYKISLQIDDAVVAGFSDTGTRMGDGGSINLSSSMDSRTIQVRTPDDGLVIKSNECMVYLKANDPWNVNAPRGYHLCEGDFQQRKSHPEKRCRP
mgnify:CR=1 FL=1